MRRRDQPPSLPRTLRHPDGICAQGRSDQSEESVEITLSDSEIQSLLATIEQTEASVDEREADFENVRNPRRLELLKNKLLKMRPPKASE